LKRKHFGPASGVYNTPVGGSISIYSINISEAHAGSGGPSILFAGKTRDRVKEYRGKI
jgi:hypothetical protein